MDLNDTITLGQATVVINATQMHITGQLIETNGDMLVLVVEMIAQNQEQTAHILGICDWLENYVTALSAPELVHLEETRGQAQAVLEQAQSCLGALSRVTQAVDDVQSAIANVGDNLDTLQGIDGQVGHELEELVTALAGLS